MKIQIRQINPNPYRDMKNYPINREKVEALKASIEQTGFWDNILAREINGVIQLAYGHHRLVALREVFKPENIIDIPVKRLTDALMLKIMAKENDNEWETNIAVTDETVRQTRKFLKQHPEEIKTKKPISHSVSTGGDGFYRKSPEAFQIAEFLDWSEQKVYNSLVRIGMIEEGKIEKKVIESMPTAKAADRFVSAVKSRERDKNPISIERQRQTFERLKKEDDFSEKAIREEIIRDTWEQPKKKQEYKSEKIIKYESYVAGIRNKADELFEDLKQLAKTEKELGEISENIYRKLLEMSLNTLSKQIEIIIKKQENEKSKFTNSDLAGIAG